MDHATWTWTMDIIIYAIMADADGRRSPYGR